MRLFWVSFFGRRRAPLSPLGLCETPFRCWFNDLDVLRHMNNGRYLTLLDLGRLDLMNRSGLSRLAKERGWYPVVAAETIRFKKSLKLFQRFTIETLVVGWDEKAFLVRHRFVSGGDLYAEAFIRARLLKKSGGRVPPGEVIAHFGFDPVSPPLPAPVAAWSEALG